MTMNRRDAVTSLALVAELIATARQAASARRITTRVSSSRTSSGVRCSRRSQDRGEEKTYTVGQMSYEQPAATHEVSRNASATQPAKLLAMIFAKKESTLTTPGPAPGRG